MNLSARPQFARTILAGYIGGSLLTDGVADVAGGDPWGWLWVTFGAAAFVFLLQHLREQALRGMNRPGAAWSRTDTANVAFLAALTALILINTRADNTIQPAEAAACYTVAAIYIALILDFALQRRQTLQTSAPQSAPLPS
ncbi:hypothetical protein [Paractinoplanes maris]|uniref:hypothetical protein n=1 Tax=Paractinoplanes maris TaxID=1734446 RepID=UPI002020A19C|nr:hypothetical protein [Actinoplanes maris]